MADSYITIGSTGIKKKTHDNADADNTFSDYVSVNVLPADPLGANADAIVAAGATGSISAKMRRMTQGLEDLKTLITLAGIAPYPSASVDAVYSPSTTAYTKITPNAAMLHMEVRARTTSDDLYKCSLITHKIADATTITSAAPTTDETDRLRATEFKGDCNVHMASITYHEVAGPVITAADATDDATLIALCQEIDLDLKAHAASTTQHGGRADAVFVAALNALALPATPTTGQCRTYLADAALKAAWDAHRAVTDHLAGVQQYVTYAAGTPILWDSLGSFYVRCSTSGGLFTTEEMRSA